VDAAAAQAIRLYHKRMQGLGGGAGGAGGSHSSGSGTDVATEHLFAMGPVPFLPPGHRAPAATDSYPPFSTMGGAHHHQQHHQIGHFHHPATRPLGHYGDAAVAGFDHGFLSRVGPPTGSPGMHHSMVGGGAGMGMMAPTSFADEMDLGS
jgi:hypothetical protein